MNREVMNISCKLCNKSFYFKNSLHHYRTHHLKSAQKDHECNICDLKFYTDAGLDTHLLYHKNKSMEGFKCNYCDETFITKSGVILHTNVEHNKPYDTSLLTKEKSDMCQTSATHKNSRRSSDGNPRKVSHIYSNIISEIVYSSDSDCEYEIIKTVVKVSSNSKESDKKCPSCNKLFVKRSSLTNHMKKHRDSSNDIAIDKQEHKQNERTQGTPLQNGQKRESGLDNNRDRELQNHETSSRKERISVSSSKDTETSALAPKNFKMHGCHYCKRKFSSSANLANHLKTHIDFVAPKGTTKSPKYRCAICLKVYNNKLIYENHMAAEHAANFETDTKLPQTAIFANKGNQEPNYTEVSEKNSSNGKLANTKISSGMFSCEICGIQYGTSSHLSAHMKIHNESKPFLCNICGKSFVIKRYLTVHLKTHSTEKPLTCRFCGKGFVQKGNLVEHLRTHTGDKPHLCSYCQKSFSHYSGLRQHLQTHIPEKQFLCNVCGKDFRFSGHYREHMRTHSGDRPHVCKTCHHGFASSSSLIVHLRTHTGERPFQCGFCHHGFIKSYGLKQHYKSHPEHKPQMNVDKLNIYTNTDTSN